MTTLVGVGVALVLAGHAILATSSTLMDPPSCSLTLRLAGSEIVDFGCQEEPTICVAVGADWGWQNTACTLREDGPEEEPSYSCWCCEEGDPLSPNCAGGVESGQCRTLVRVPDGQNPLLYCWPVGACVPGHGCFYSPIPHDGVNVCDCR